MVAFSCFGALNGKHTCPQLCSNSSLSLYIGSTFTSARLIYVAGRERYLPSMFGRLHKTRKTPLNAMLLQAALTIMFIAIGGGFRSLMTFSVVASWAFYFLTVSYQQDEPYGPVITIRIGTRTCNLACQGTPARKVTTLNLLMMIFGVFDGLTERPDHTRPG
jgi:L-asparagine transporter-like permease